MRTALLLVLCGVCSAADLAPKLTTLVESAPIAVRGVAGVHVVDLATGATVYAYNENQLLMPSSNLKLFTAALALARLGPDYRSETRLLREPSGSLALIGSGDPSMSGRAYPYDASAKMLPTMHTINELADQAVAAGLRRVDGDIVGDDSRYHWSPYPESWTADDAQHAFGAPVSALALNDNAVTITVRPGTSVGGLARVELDPLFEYFQIDNRVVTGTASSVQAQRIPGTRQVVLTGTINSRGPAALETLAVDDPALFTAHALYDALLRRGVTVRGRPVARHLSGTPSTAEGALLASRKSPPLAELLRTTIKVSQNLHAEMLLREVAYVKKGQGTVDDGLRELKSMLTELGISQAAVVSEDASGLARNNEATPRAVTQLLAAMAAGPLRDLWRGLLPVGGQDGTLSNRLCCSVESVSIRAKTGTLTRAVALSGYADSPANGHLAFSILVNNFSAPAAEVRAWVDSVASALVE